MVKLTSRGSFKKTDKFLEEMKSFNITTILHKYGNMGVERLREYTPKDTGLTSESWTYTINSYGDRAGIEWWNTNENEGVPIALMIQYGHGMPNGTYIRGKDYINPALKPIFDELAERVWEEVRRA